MMQQGLLIKLVAMKQVTWPSVGRMGWHSKHGRIVRVIAWTQLPKHALTNSLAGYRGTSHTSYVCTREYWMIYRGLRILAVVWFGFTPPPLSKLDRRQTGRPRMRDTLLTGEGGKGWVWSRIIRPQKSLKIIQYTLVWTKPETFVFWFLICSKIFC